MDTSIPLDNAGLSPGEQKVYLALLKSGPSKVTSLKKATQLHRTTIYDFLESLIKKGLVSYSLDGKTRVFKAAEPHRLLSLLDERREAVESALPSLNSLMSSGLKNLDIEIFQGKEGLKSLLNDTFVHTKEKEYLVMGAVMEFEVYLPYFMEHLLVTVEKKRMRGRIILNPDDIITVQKFEDWRVINQKNLMPMGLGIIGDVVVLFIWKPQISAIRIINKEVARSYRVYFEALWQIARPVTKEELEKKHRRLGEPFKIERKT